MAFIYSSIFSPPVAVLALQHLAWISDPGQTLPQRVEWAENAFRHTQKFRSESLMELPEEFRARFMSLAVALGVDKHPMVISGLLRGVLGDSWQKHSVILRSLLQVTTTLEPNLELEEVEFNATINGTLHGNGTEDENILNVSIRTNLII